MCDRQRLRSGIWFTPAGHIAQHCPACHTPVAIPDLPGYDDPGGDARGYQQAVEHGLDDAVFDHLVLDQVEPSDPDAVPSVTRDLAVGTYGQLGTVGHGLELPAVRGRSTAQAHHRGESSGPDPGIKGAGKGVPTA